MEISLTDQEGVLNPEADCAVSISVEGPGEIIGFGSADPDSPENYFDRTAKPLRGDFWPQCAEQRNREP